MVLIGAAIKSVLRYLRKTSGDGDSKWAVHYTTQKPQQGLRFIRGKRQSNSADDLRAFHWPSQQSPGSKRCPSSPTFSPFSGMDQSDGGAHRGWRDRSRKMSSASSDDDERFFLTKGRPMTPLVLNPISLTSCSDGLRPTFESNWDTETDPIQRLPTPEEQMRRQAEAIAADIVPINVTGESFDRQASFRKTLSNSDSLSRRSRKLTRRKTVSNLQDDVSPKASVSVDLPGQFSTVGRPASSCGSSGRQKNKGAEVKEGGEKIRTDQLSSRRIRAPKGEGMSSLMATLTSSPCIERQPTSETQTECSPTSNYSSDCDPYKMLNVSSSYCQSWDLQGFPSDLDPQMLYDTNVLQESPSSSCPCFLSTPNTPCHLHQPESTHSNKIGIAENPSCSHYLSTSSISDSVSQYSYQVLDDETAIERNAQYFHDSDSCDGKRWNYKPISPSFSVYSHGTNETRGTSEENWNCDPLLSSGRSTPSCTDSNSCCSEITSYSSLSRRKSSTSSYYSPTVTRSISLRKSKRPPPPPVRSDSLRRRSGRSKPPRASSSLRLERSPRAERSASRTPTSSPQVFYDPWVPQSSPKQQQTVSNCRTVSTFEPLKPDVAPSTDSPALDSTQTSHEHSHVLDSKSSGSKDEQLKFPDGHDASEFSVAGIQRLASPSSGYSSQSNTPTPGTPVSSPLSPSSPLTPNHDGKAGSPPGPLVTAQALQGVKLRSVKNQEEQRANNTGDSELLNEAGSKADDRNRSMTAQHYRAELDVVISETLGNTEVELTESRLSDAFSDVVPNDVNGFLGNSDGQGRDDAKPTNKMQTKPETRMTVNESADSKPQNHRGPDSLKKSQPVKSVSSPEHPKENPVRNPSLGNSEMCDLESPWVKMSHSTEKNSINAVIDQEQWVLETELTNTAEKKRGNVIEPSENKSKVNKKDDANGDSTSPDMKNIAANFKSNMTRKTNSPETCSTKEARLFPSGSTGIPKSQKRSSWRQKQWTEGRTFFMPKQPVPCSCRVLLRIAAACYQEHTVTKACEVLC
ncbi:hypothetical protein OJAV_G00014170 [Oryzias javanicus]|uniref:NHS-like protein 1 n=1 Tax=Oryzias javanicus TaxID=123683 RepID=A0A3S2N7D2_ORYJA|nr:hypothetical protein OJAV_G00014170 [Oryzias javanicus]